MSKSCSPSSIRLIMYGFTSPQEFFTYMETWPLPVKFRPLPGAQGLWAGRGLYRATPAVTRNLGFSGLIRRTAPFSRLLRHTRGYGGSILTWILTGFLLRRWQHLHGVNNSQQGVQQYIQAINLRAYINLFMWRSAILRKYIQLPSTITFTNSFWEFNYTRYLHIVFTIIQIP
jgi:hypothetical protein